ncbi:HAD family hydrolase [Glycomyces buryatensis]|uniref:HAD family phosphatase n=1 Tax=Glycomyces buryatensis TaxID=2570927 RepID=A0A4S8PV35_9ACTN|nr:HAD family hydrolase [Glycomyces buryatensis]THV33622.1 HAD family phosphatase [Glycomyces buryatensis]
MQTPNVIASDLDGTLLGPDHQLTERTRKALVAAREHGFAIVAVTARTPYGVANLPGLMELVDTAICANGAIFCQPEGGDIRILRSIPLPVARKVSETLTELLPGAAFAVETGTGIVGEGPYQELVNSPNWDFADSLEGVFDRAERVVKIKLYHPERTGDDMAAAVAGADLSELDMCHWGDFGMLDFNAPGVNKATGLEIWCTEHGYGPEDVVAFGDMPNDAPMLSWAGRSYAVGDAHPETLAAATDRAKSNAEDGVAQVIEGLIEAARSVA